MGELVSKCPHACMCVEVVVYMYVCVGWCVRMQVYNFKYCRNVSYAMCMWAIGFLATCIIHVHVIFYHYYPLCSTMQ